jgi:hypothetical protein
VAADDEQNRLAALKTTLDAARGLVRNLQENELFGRLLDAFMRMPEADRATVIGALEREVQTRVLSQEVGDTLTKIALRPNPNARLYLRVVEPDTEDAVETTAFLRAAYSVQRGIDALDPTWRAMIAAALRQMDPAARARIDQFNRAMRTVLDETDAEAPPAEPPAPGDPPGDSDVAKGASSIRRT